MINDQNSKQYDLEDRTYNFAQSCRLFLRKLPRTISNIEDVSQAVRSSGSVAANYIEANEALSKKDFIHRIKICRKESKETKLWLRLVYIGENQSLDKERTVLVKEAAELLKIFSSIAGKSE